MLLAQARGARLQPAASAVAPTSAVVTNSGPAPRISALQPTKTKGTCAKPNVSAHVISDRYLFGPRMATGEGETAQRRTFGQYCLISGTHFSGTLSNESRRSCETGRVLSTT